MNSRQGCGVTDACVVGDAAGIVACAPGIEEVAEVSANIGSGYGGLCDAVVKPRGHGVSPRGSEVNRGPDALAVRRTQEAGFMRWLVDWLDFRVAEAARPSTGGTVGQRAMEGAFRGRYLTGPGTGSRREKPPSDTQPAAFSIASGLRTPI